MDKKNGTRINDCGDKQPFGCITVGAVAATGVKRRMRWPFSDRAARFMGLLINCTTLPGAAGNFKVDFNKNGVSMMSTAGTGAEFAREVKAKCLIKYTAATTTYEVVTDDDPIVLDDMAAADRLYIGQDHEFVGVSAIVSKPNGNAAVMAGSSNDGEKAVADWTALGTVVDGTDAAGASLGVTGEVAYDEPAKFKRAFVTTTGFKEVLDRLGEDYRNLNWIELHFGAALDNEVELTAPLATIRMANVFYWFPRAKATTELDSLYTVGPEDWLTLAVDEADAAAEIEVIPVFAEGKYVGQAKGD